MSSRNYTIAMANDIHTGAYDPPLRDPSQGGSEWLIVRRWGDFGEFLEISDTTVPPHDPAKNRGKFDKPVPAEAPSGLKPHNSMLGLMVRSSGDSGATFLLVRRNIDKHVLGGKFYPVDGYCEIELSAGRWTLKASGRHAHDASGKDIPDPKVGAPVRMSWHFDAQAVYWCKQEL
jgi:hypothetical protein